MEKSTAPESYNPVGSFLLEDVMYIMDTLDIFHVAKYLLMFYEIREKFNEDSKCVKYLHKLFFEGKDFDNPLNYIRANSRLEKPEAIKLQEIIDDKENREVFIYWLDRLDLNSNRVKILTDTTTEVRSLPTAYVNWEETTFGGGAKYIHLYYGRDAWAGADGFNAAECNLLRLLYTAYVLVEYNKEE